MMASDDQDIDKDDLIDRTWKSYTRKEITTEAIELVRMGLPVMLSSLIFMAVVNTNILFVGHLGKIELAAIALGSMFTIVTGNSWMAGMLTAAETLISQANGAGNFIRVGILLQRTIMIMTLLSIPVTILWIVSGHLLIALGQDPEVSTLAGQYISVMSLGLFPFVFGESLKRYLIMQGHMRPPLYAITGAAIANPLFQYLFIYVLEWGIRGSALGTVMSQIINSLILMIYIWGSGMYRKTWFGFSTKALRDWPEFIKLGFPGAMMVFLEWGSLEAVALVVGLLHQPEMLAAYIIISNTCSIAFVIPAGIGTAANSRVGNFLGAGKFGMAKLVCLVSFFCGLFFIALTSLTFFLLRDLWPTLFSPDEDVRSIVSEGLVVVALGFMTFDGVQANMGGILRGSGNQKYGALISFVAFYFVGIPASLYTTLVLGWGIVGTWGGLSLAAVILAVGYTTVTFRSNWRRLSIDARSRANKTYQPIDEDMLVL
eukprot:TRINITY_DN5005_c0_g1_i5.p1 TRINITY_DN5005_c0_g1~~TRINITY_DN5005_c0_g1_i5.p1  ORF type:complete len:486 (-),score=124.96 TRINITY_DN5005_c0_g1_i5:245-1702(-)